MLLVDSTHEALLGEPWRWIGMWTYLLDDSLIDDSAALSALIRSDAYSDSYLGNVQENRIGDQLVHGPYVTDRLREEMFDNISSAEAGELIQDYVCSGAYKRSIESVSFSGHLKDLLSSASSIYKLRSEQDAFHELHWMTGDFTEIVLIDRTRRHLVNVVMAYS